MSTELTAINSIINTKGLDIAKPKSFAEFVVAAKELQGQLEAAWGLVEQQMLDRNITSIEGSWGAIRFEPAELLVITDASVLDPSITKAALDTTKVRAYRELMGELPSGIDTKVINKFVKRIKK